MLTLRPRRLLTPAQLIIAALALGGGLLASAPVAAAATQTPGVQAHVLWSNVDYAEMTRQLDRAKSAGAQMVRVDVGWGTLEPVRKGSYDSWYLARLDALVNEARSRGLKLLMLWWLTPCWASSAPADVKQDCQGAWWERGVAHYPPTEASDYADTLAFLVGRYRDRVAAWEIWNEPNLDYYFKATDKAGSYTALVRAAYPAAKRAYRKATVVAGALSESDSEFTESLYRKGIKGSFDAFSIHPYSGDHGPLNPLWGWPSRYSFVRGVPAVRERMLAHVDPKPLWLTEFGWSTCSYRGGEPWANCVDERVQAEHLEDAYAQVRKWSYVRVALWYGLIDLTTNTADRISNYGLLRHDGSGKPSYSAFQRAAKALRKRR